MNQKQVWDNIAKEWYKFKTEPAEHTLKFLNNKTGKILDLGGGSGRNIINISNGEMYLVDFSDKMIKFAKQKAKKNKIKAQFFLSELTKLPFSDNFFDYAIAVASLHCIPESKNRKNAIKELFRVLKPGAEAEISVWNKQSKTFKNSPKEKYIAWHDKGKRYYYLFDEKEIHDLFKSVGFKIKKKFEPKRNIIFVVQK